jgi:hypothetical protein
MGTFNALDVAPRKIVSVSAGAIDGTLDVATNNPTRAALINLFCVM